MKLKEEQGQPGLMRIQFFGRRDILQVLGDEKWEFCSFQAMLPFFLGNLDH